MVVYASRVRWKEAWQIAIKWTHWGIKRIKEEMIRRASIAVAHLQSQRGPQGQGEGTSQTPEAIVLHSQSGPPSAPVGEQGGSNKKKREDMGHGKRQGRFPWSTERWRQSSPGRLQGLNGLRDLRL